jgi:hypothetical protein
LWARAGPVAPSNRSNVRPCEASAAAAVGGGGGGGAAFGASIFETK